MPVAICFVCLHDVVHCIHMAVAVAVVVVFQQLCDVVVVVSRGGTRPGGIVTLYGYRGFRSENFEALLQVT